MRLIVLAGVFLFSFSATFTQNQARPLTYSEALAFAKKEWPNRFPVAFISLNEINEPNRILSVTIQGLPVYYYRFTVELPRLYRDEKNAVQQEAEPARSDELWLRYQPYIKQGDFTFARSDLLAGQNRRFIE